MIIKDMKRLIADEGKILKNTKDGRTAYCVDTFVELANNWEEVEDIEYKEDKIVGE